MPTPVVALAAWLVPGGGYLLLGQVARALTVGLTVIALFVGGLLIGGMKVVDEPDWSKVAPASGDGGVRLGERVSNALRAVVEKPWFVGQFLAGPGSLAIARKAWARTPDNPYAISHSRSNEIGTLYTAVAGMLNLLAIIDASYRAARAREAT